MLHYQNAIRESIKIPKDVWLYLIDHTKALDKTRNMKLFVLSGKLDLFEEDGGIIRKVYWE